MRHCAAFVLFGHGLKCATRVRIGKRVKERDTSVELLLNFSAAGNREGDDAEFFGCSMTVGLLRGGRRGKNKQQSKEKRW